MELADIWHRAFYPLMAIAGLLLFVVYVKLKERQRDRNSGHDTGDRAGSGNDSDGYDVPADMRKRSDSLRHPNRTCVSGEVQSPGMIVREDTSFLTRLEIRIF